MLIWTFDYCNNCHDCAARLHILCEMCVGCKQNHLREMLKWDQLVIKLNIGKAIVCELLGALSF